MSEPALPFPKEPLARAQITWRGASGRVVYWAPVWVPMAVLAQVALLGLGPALAEERRIEAAEVELTARIAHEREEREQLERALRAQNDPIYLERERRLLRAEHGPLSTR
jgi:hypothetical protein